jgi:curli biogenesis system outer membrane secretion channel CsgG
MNDMKPIITAALCVFFSGATCARAQDMDKELAKLADKLAVTVKEQGKKKVTVLDFTDLEGGGSELGKYIAEELTVNLVMAKRDFSVLDRANLRKVLAEHKLTASGLIDPDTAKKLGQFAGVDALILGTIVPKGSDVRLNAKIITVDTAEVVGAVRAEFKSDEQAQKLIERPIVAGSASEKAQVVKSFGDLGVELNSLSIANARNYVLDFVLKNQNTKKSIWVALSIEQNGETRLGLTDPDRFDFHSQMNLVKGVECAARSYDGAFYKGTEIKPGESISGTLTFFSRGGRTATTGQCSVQLEFLVGYSMNPTGGGRAEAKSLTGKMEVK